MILTLYLSSLTKKFDTTTAAGEMVLYTVANIAQFERRQISERVAANLESRASRGLYNGGTVPLGYKLIPEKLGHLEVDEEGAAMVRLAYKTFLETGGISATAKFLNTRGYCMKKETQGGNSAGRSGVFTVVNLDGILRNKAYIGIRRYKSANGSAKEVKACWPAIVDIELFQSVQNELKKKEECKRKPESENRYPFLLTGLVRCASCNAHMIGKSAHGNSGKVPYYEHGWAARMQSVTLKKVCDCKPFRLQAKKLEPLVWAEVEKLISSPEMAKSLIDELKTIHLERTQSSETKRCSEKVRQLGMQMDVLAERLSELPKSVSPVAIFKQMEKLEGLRNIEEERLSALKTQEVTADPPANLESYKDLLAGLKQLTNAPEGHVTRDRIVRSLIHKVEVTPDGFRLHFHLGRGYIEGELARYGRSPHGGSGSSNIFSHFGSNRLTNGAPRENRTPMTLRSVDFESTASTNSAIRALS
jgi:hypothetical protein